jgi:REP element-mobilizing transposase RayT|tara:strand:- start:78 stop:539 length:462 start_codon:yes stop_codon:yes gene_type:complete
MRIDTRNNWLTKMFKCKYAYNCLQKQTVMETCTKALREFEKFGFEFSEIGYGGNHVHFTVDVPKRYSVLTTITMLKSRTSKIIFEKHPNFRKRYPRGSFWSEYEHHESTGKKDLKASEEYIRNQQKHHQVKVIDDRQKKLNVFYRRNGGTFRP